MIGHFSEQSLTEVQDLLFAEWENPYSGKCGQKKLREQNKKPRTPAQEQADLARGQALRGKTRGGDRSAAARKAAETRKRCKGGGNTPASSSGITV